MTFTVATANTGPKKKIKSIRPGRAITSAQNARTSAPRIGLKARFTSAGKTIPLMTLTMKTNLFTHQHAMTLFNHELAVEYHFENDKIKITEIMFKHYKNHNLVHFMSGKIFKLIVEDIENNAMKIRWIDND